MRDKDMLSTVRHIDDQQKILQLLDIANREVANLRIRIDNAATTYFSSVIDIEPEENTITLELLRPDSGNALLHRADSVEIEVFLRNSKLKWTSTVLKDDYIGLPDFFQVSLPLTLEYTQQRLAFRVVPREEISLTLSHPEHGAIHGEMVNLSVDGVAAKVPQQFIAAMQPGAFYQDCLVHLPEHDVLCSIEVRHLDTGTAMFGARFCSLSKLHQHTVTQFIADTDRSLQRGSDIHAA